MASTRRRPARAPSALLWPDQSTHAMAAANEPAGAGPVTTRTDWATKEDIRELEGRFDARFQSVSARFVRVDNRFAGHDSRLDEVERRHKQLDDRSSTRFDVLEAQLRAADARIEELRAQLHRAEARQEQVQMRVDQHGRRIFAAVLASAVLSLVLWSASTVALLSLAR